VFPRIARPIVAVHCSAANKPRRLNVAFIRRYMLVIGPLSSLFEFATFGLMLAVYRTCAELRDKGARIVREPGPMKHGTTEIAFVEDQDGYRVELIQTRAR